ncbi:hypothetical protein AaE_010882, partial [Aphanomyces astaci]
GQSRSSRRRDRQAAATGNIQTGGEDPSLATGRGKGSILNPALINSSSTKLYDHSLDDDDLGSPMNGRGNPYVAATDVYHPLPATASGHALLPMDVVMGHDVILQSGGTGQHTPMLCAGSTMSEDIQLDMDMDSSAVFVYVSVAAFQRLARQFQELMEEATSLYVHMIRSRLNEYGGVELRFSEGYFVVMFQTEFNAARWCLAMQLGLMYAAWNPRFLRAP